MTRIFLLISLFAYTLSHSMENTQKNPKPSYATMMCLSGINDRDLQRMQRAFSKGADVNYVDDNKQSLFSKACNTHDKDIITMIVEQENLDLSLQFLGYKPIHYACSLGLTNAAKKMLIKDKQQAYAVNGEHKQTALHAACSSGKIDCINLLLSSTKETIDWQDYYGETSLYKACAEIQFDTIKTLLLNNANPTIKNKDEATPLIYLFSITNGHPKFHNERASFFKENPEITNILVSTTDKNNNNQFHLCTKVRRVDYHRFEQFILFLISYNLDINAKNNDGKKAIHIACEKYQNLYKKYLSSRLANELEKIIELKKRLDNQEKIMHLFLRFTPSVTQYALFTEILQKLEKYDDFLPKDVKNYIAYLYYLLHIDTIIAKKYANDENYYNDSMAIVDKIAKKQQLLKNPEPALLRNAS